MSTEVTPLIAQYFSIKADYAEALVLFQVGDFYELFFDDAKTAAQFLALTLTKRGKHQGEDIPLCGIPVHTVRHYITKLVKGGFAVALCDQVTKPVPGQVVKRAVTQVFTPGTLVDEGLLEEKNSSYLLTYVVKNAEVGLVFTELVSGQLFATTLTGDYERGLESELAKFAPDEVISLPDAIQEQQSINLSSVFKRNGYRVGHVDPQVFPPFFSREWAENQLGSEVTGQLMRQQLLVAAFDILTRYLQRHHQQALSYLNQIHFYKPAEFLVIDAPTQKNLELVTNNQDASSKYTLFSVIDRAQTVMGSRLIKRWLTRPLIDVDAIVQRQQVVETFYKNISLLHHVQQLLRAIPDIERIAGRVALGRATHQDYLGVKRVLNIMPGLLQLLAPHADAARLLVLIGRKLYVNQALFIYLDAALSEELGADKQIKKGFDAELDELRDLVEASGQKILEFEQREIEQSGIGSLKVRYTDVFGYGIEITKTHYDNVPAHYIAQQTLANRTRYVTQELKELEARILDARRRVSDVEREVYNRVKNEVAKHVAALRLCAQAVAMLDALVGFAVLAYENRYTKPLLNTEGRIVITGGRHPVVEQTLQGIFTPNDTLLNDEALLHIITGPNMGGKSTYLRQIALICLLAHVGAFVPASYADVAILDRIFTRIGSGDDLAGGKSTFWVEMEETALICQQATQNSLIILDEVGRGTSTYDGMAIAYALIEFFVSKTKARGLFATHYHELTQLAEHVPGLKNYSVACKKTGNDLLFLHKVVPGVASGSFGLEIAQKAGIPGSIVIRAREVLGAQNMTPTYPAVSGVAEGEVGCASNNSYERINPVLETLKSLDPDELTPRQAHELLRSLQKEAGL